MTTSGLAGRSEKNAATRTGTPEEGARGMDTKSLGNTTRGSAHVALKKGTKAGKRSPEEGHGTSVPI